MPEPLVGQRLSISGSGTTKLAIASNLPLDKNLSSVRLGVISIHGSGSPAHKYFARAMTALRGVEPGSMPDGAATPFALRDRMDVIVLAPQFIRSADFSGPGSLPGNVLRWGSAFWGQNASNGGNPSSFHVLDEMIRFLCNRTRYRNLERIVLVGHSGGGQILNRYAAAGVGETFYAKPIGVGVRYIVMNPGSYQYFSAERPISGSETNFGIPGIPNVASCPNYNSWGHGIFGPLEPYHATHGLGISQLESQYRQRNVVYLIGSEDNNPNSSSLPNSCSAQLQGPHRLARSRAYFNHLADHFGNTILRKQQHAIIQGAGHSGGQMLRSPVTRRYIFEPFRDKPKLSRRGKAGKAGYSSAVCVIRHWDDLNNNAENQFVSAVRTENGRLKLISWRMFDNGDFIRVNNSATSPHGARSIGIIRIRREESSGGSTSRVMTYVTAYKSSGSTMRLLTWDTDAQGSFQSPVPASTNVTGSAELVRLVRLSRDRFATVQRDPGGFIVAKLWSVGNSGSLQLLATSDQIAGEFEEFVLVRRNSRRFFIVGFDNNETLRIRHLSATNASVSPPALTIDSGQVFPTHTGNEICATRGPYGYLIVGYRDATSEKLRMLTFSVNSGGQSMIHDNPDDAGRISSGTSIMAMRPYGVCTAVRTADDNGKLIFWRLTPGGKIKRVCDSGSSLGQVKRHHNLTDAASVIGSDIVFGCSDDNTDLKLIGYRYTS